MSVKRKTRAIPISRRSVSPAEKKRWNDAAQLILDRCDELFDLSGNFDTAVRDSMAQGLAPLVQAAFDCRAQTIEFADTEAWMLFIDTSTAEWFREKGFVEWFAAAAGMQFRTTPPRVLTAAIEHRRKSA
jgi:hypothetical protein